MATQQVATPKALQGGQYLPNAVAAIYTVGGATTAILKRIIVFNSDVATRTVYIYLVPTGGAVDNSTLKWKLTINAGQTYEIETMAILGAADTIQAYCDIANKANISAYGAEVTSVS